MRTFSMMLLIAVLAMACKKEETPPQTPPTPPASPYFVKLKDDGINWSANGVTSALDVGSTIHITGASLTASQLTIILEKPIQVGTYIVDGQTMGVMSFRRGFNPNSLYSTFNSPGYGLVNITKAGPVEYEGTFEFVGVNMNGQSRNFTDGEFKVKMN